MNWRLLLTPASEMPRNDALLRIVVLAVISMFWTLFFLITPDAGLTYLRWVTFLVGGVGGFLLALVALIDFIASLEVVI